MISDQPYSVSWKVAGRLLWEADQAALAEQGRLAERPIEQRSWELLPQADRVRYYYMALTLLRMHYRLGKMGDRKLRAIYSTLDPAWESVEPDRVNAADTHHESFIQHIVGS